MQYAEPIHPRHAPELIRLRDEVATLREQNRQLRQEAGALPDAIFVARCKSVLGISASKAKLLSILLDGTARSHEGILLAYTDPRRDPPDLGVLKTQISYLRCALQGYQIKITTAWGQGYYLTDDAKESVRALLADGAQG